jgi:hypothetical protein
MSLMTKNPEIRCYDYVNHSYERVRDVLKKDPLAIFQSATRAAASRAQSVSAELHVDFGGVGVSTDIRILIKSIEEKPADAIFSRKTHLLLEWEAAARPGLFPIMKGELSVYPLTATETQLDFWGLYEPPFGAVGKAVDTIVGHRIAEASLHRFITDVAGYLRKALA